MLRERAAHPGHDAELPALDVDLDDRRPQAVRLDLRVDGRDLDVDRLALREAARVEARERRVRRRGHVELRAAGRGGGRLRDDDDVRARVQPTFPTSCARAAGFGSNASTRPLVARAAVTV